MVDIGLVSGAHSLDTLQFKFQSNSLTNNQVPEENCKQEQKKDLTWAFTSRSNTSWSRRSYPSYTDFLKQITTEYLNVLPGTVSLRLQVTTQLLTIGITESQLERLWRQILTLIWRRCMPKLAAFNFLKLIYLMFLKTRLSKLRLWNKKKRHILLSERSISISKKSEISELKESVQFPTLMPKPMQMQQSKPTKEKECLFGKTSSTPPKLWRILRINWHLLLQRRPCSSISSTASWRIWARIPRTDWSMEESAPPWLSDFV